MQLIIYTCMGLTSFIRFRGTEVTNHVHETISKPSRTYGDQDVHYTYKIREREKSTACAFPGPCPNPNPDPNSNPNPNPSQLTTSALFGLM